MNKRILASILAAVQLLTVPALAAEGDPPEDTAPEEQPGETPAPSGGSTLLTASHIAYMSGSHAMFRPEDNISRAEAAQIIYRLLPGEGEGENENKDGNRDETENENENKENENENKENENKNNENENESSENESENSRNENKNEDENGENGENGGGLEITASYSDVDDSAWYAQAARTLGALGVIRPGEEKFLPDEEVTRSEFVRYLSSFFMPRTDAEQFSDVPENHPDAPYLLSARAWGWLNGYEDGTVRPDDPITRSGAVTMVNRALGRAPDKSYIDSNHPAFYLDVEPESWYYYDVEEASAAHEYGDETGAEVWVSHTAVPCELEDGLHSYNGWLYYYDSERGDIVRDDSAEDFYFNGDGHFSSGNAELDAKLRNIVLNKTNSGMTQEQKLRALYVYTRDSFTYFRRPAYEFGVLDFMQKDALDMLTTGRGNCYCYASVFWYLARWIGYDAVIYNGTVGSGRQPHSWVEIAIDGKNYVFDTELEMAYHKKGRYDVNLYKYLDNGTWHYVR